MVDWTNKLLGKEINGASCATGIVMSAEYINKNDSDEMYVTKLYRTFLDREPDELKKQDQMEWVRRMNNIRNRAEAFVKHDLIYS